MSAALAWPAAPAARRSIESAFVVVKFASGRGPHDYECALGPEPDYRDAEPKTNHPRSRRSLGQQVLVGHDHLTVGAARYAGQP